MRAYYNEIDPFAAQWIRNLIAAGHVMAGDVDERSIVDVRPDDLVGYTRCHFFAGIAVWDYALGLAGWPAERPVWTGSCPCQPFSAAGKGGGISDERHLWPALFHLIEQRRPAVFLGEQVASKDGLDWLDLVHADLEGAHYDVGAVDLCAAGVGAPHIRQRLWLVADGSGKRSHGVEASPECGRVAGAQIHRAVGGLADRDGGDAGAARLQRGGEHGQRPEDSLPVRSRDRWFGHNGGPEMDRTGEADGFWAEADWLFCRDARWRPVEPGTFPLAHGATARVGRLRAYGNAINAEAAKAFIEAVMMVRP